VAKKKGFSFGPREWSPRGEEGIKINPRIRTLSRYLDLPPTEIEELSGLANYFGAPRGQEYLVYTNEEASREAQASIEDSLWTIPAEVIIRYTNLPKEAEEMIGLFQDKKMERANETIRALIKNIDVFMRDVISDIGRGHFLSSYDGIETKEGDFFIYRVG